MIFEIFGYEKRTLNCSCFIKCARGQQFSGALLQHGLFGCERDRLSIKMRLKSIAIKFTLARPE